MWVTPVLQGGAPRRGGKALSTSLVPFSRCFLLSQLVFLSATYILVFFHVMARSQRMIAIRINTCKTKRYISFNSFVWFGYKWEERKKSYNNPPQHPELMTTGWHTWVFFSERFHFGIKHRRNGKVCLLGRCSRPRLTSTNSRLISRVSISRSYLKRPEWMGTILTAHGIKREDEWEQWTEFGAKSSDESFATHPPSHKQLVHRPMYTNTVLSTLWGTPLYMCSEGI